MTSTAKKFLSASTARAASAGLLALCSLLSTAAQAQQLYRIVGADGKITFSDQPPAPSSNAKVSAGSSATGGVVSNTAALPFELRQVASKYPVTLYTGDNCAPCASARSMLLSRGIPFSEKTVNTNDDGQALQRLSGDNSLPFATIGGQQLKGYADVEWTQYLTAAGYPTASVLPANYRQSPASPLAPSVAAPAANSSPNTAAGKAPAAAAPAAPAPVVSNPAGIKF